MAATEFFLDLQTATQQADCPSQAVFTTWAQLALQQTEPSLGAEVTLRLVDEAESQALNATYRGKNKPTNILSFPCDAPIDFAAEGELTLLGDLIICAPLVVAEAQAQNKPALHHWAHLVIHGMLHLQGYDHETPEQASCMETLEIQLLSQLGIPDPYTATTEQADSQTP